MQKQTNSFPRLSLCRIYWSGFVLNVPKQPLTTTSDKFTLVQLVRFSYASCMDHITFLKTLPPDLSAKLCKRQNRAGILHLIAHLALILISGTLITLHVPFWPLLLPLQGIFIIFLFTLEHEATHKTPFASEPLNEWVGHAIGFTIFLPFQWFRYFHLAHHRYTNIPGKDPELLAGAKPEGWTAYIKYVSGIPYWTTMIIQIIRNAMGQASAPYLPKSTLPRLKTEARVMLALYALAALSLTLSPVLIWVWLLPILLGQPFLRLYLLAEHGRCAFVANMFENTRTTYTTKFIRFLAWNMPYHVEHHTMPNIPFHNLPMLHTYTRDHFLITEDGYIQFTRQFVENLSEQRPPDVDL